jgi:hypothetical protein
MIRILQTFRIFYGVNFFLVHGTRNLEARFRDIRPQDERAVLTHVSGMEQELNPKC